tara:strand:- start:602 stop:1456 length:855 start_codon:yes stop_codon:yes gene_type:complete
MPKYYPKSQVTNNLYTNGHELMVKSSGKEYTGKYYKISTGEMFAGTDTTAVQIRLVPLTDTHQVKNPRVKELQFTYNPQSKVYNELKYGNRIPDPLKLPSPSSPLIESSQLGEYTRYFSKKNNNTLYMEISKDTYNKINSQDNKMDLTLYSVLKLQWDPRNPQTNKNIVKLTEKNNNWVGFYNYLSPQLEEDPTYASALYTRGGEFLLPNRTSYVGYYHYMPNGDVMTGKTHGQGGDIKLIPLDVLRQSQQNDSTIPTPSSTPNITGPETINPGYSPPDSTWEY